MLHLAELHAVPACVCMCAGTTGDPKGVMLTHDAIVQAVNTANSYCKFNGINLDHTDRLLSYLPLAHIFDRWAC